MQQDHLAKQNFSSIMKPGFAGTDTQKIKIRNSKRCKRKTRCNDFTSSRSNAGLKTTESGFFISEFEVTGTGLST